MFQMMGVFAEFERSIIHERVMAGLARAKAEGTTTRVRLYAAAQRACLHDGLNRASKSMGRDVRCQRARNAGVWSRPTRASVT